MKEYSKLKKCPICKVVLDRIEEVDGDRGWKYGSVRIKCPNGHLVYKESYYEEDDACVKAKKSVKD